MPLADEYLRSIRRFEGFHRRPYWDYRQWTSGFGTRASGPDEMIDEGEANRRFRGELTRALGGVRGLGVSMTPGQEAALTSLTYNAGPGWMNSGLGAAVRAGDWRAARERFLRYVNAGGRPLPGLVSRREQEASWLDGGGPPTTAPLGAPVPPPQGGPQTPPGMGLPWWHGVGSGLLGTLVGSAQAQVPPAPGGGPSITVGARVRWLSPGETLPQLGEGESVLLPNADGSVQIHHRTGNRPATADEIAAAGPRPGGPPAPGSGVQGGSPMAGKLGTSGAPPPMPGLTPPTVLAPPAPPVGGPPPAPVTPPAPPPPAPLGPPDEATLGGAGTGLLPQGTVRSLLGSFTPAPTVPPFGAPVVTPEPEPPPSTGMDTLGYGPSGLQPMGRDVVRESGLPPSPPPDADAIMRGAQQAADDRAAQARARPGWLEGLMQNPAFLAGLSILGTAPGGNWGPNAAQAASQAIRSGREQTEWQRLQERRATMDRVWREAFGTNGQPNTSHPLLQGVPLEMAQTIFAMGAEEGLPALQRWQMFRGQQNEQRLLRQQNLALFGIGGPPPGAEEAPPSLGRLRASAGLGAIEDTSGITAPAQGGPPSVAPPPGSGVGIARPPQGGPREPVVRIGNVTIPVSQARALATAADQGTRQVLEQAIAAAERETQPPPGFRFTADGSRLEAIPGGPGEQVAADVAGRVAMMQTAQAGLPTARDFFTRSWGPGDTGRAIIGGPMFAAEYDRARRVVRVAIEGALRATTGAAAPASEVEQYMDMFMPRVTDSRETAAQKLNLLEGFMANAQTLIMRGRGGGGQPPPGGGGQRPDPLGLR